MATTAISRRLALPRLRKPLKLLRDHVAPLAKPVKAPLANLASVPLHVAGLAVFDFAAFGLPDARFWGWAVTAASLIWLEHVIADEQ